MTEEEAFKAGWKAGYFDGGEHDCRMFTPTADRAWTDHQARLRFNKLPLQERVKKYRCTGCGGPVHLSGREIRCVNHCQWGNQYQEP